jgi:peptide methionine sulfoxide reductase msrA/msrB
MLLREDRDRDQDPEERKGGRWAKRTAVALVAVCGFALYGMTRSSRSEPIPSDASRPRVMSAQQYTRPAAEQLRRSLTTVEFQVTQRQGTEPPFANAFWNNHESGLYVDVATGEPLFSSTDKFESGTGWPSFTRPVESDRVVEHRDWGLGMLRTEVRSRGGDSHLGHVFDDGPPPTHQRYCINSAALRFVPAAKLDAQGYGAYRVLFDPAPRTGAPTTAASGSSASLVSPSVAPAPSTSACTRAGVDGKRGCAPSLETAILAGGCFWGMEEILRKIPGVVETEAGYTGGKTPNPKYEDVHTGETGHAESVRIVFDRQKLSYADLLEKWFFRMHDPTTPNRQGNDVGSQYRSVIFLTSPEQRTTAEAVKARVEASGRWKRPIVTQLVDAGPFTPAESYHQKYLEKNPGGYTCHYLRD